MTERGLSAGMIEQMAFEYLCDRLDKALVDNQARTPDNLRRTLECTPRGTLFEQESQSYA